MKKISHDWIGADLETRVAAHVQAWKKIKPLGRRRALETHPFVTISREFGCEALPLAQRLIEILNERCRPSIPWVAYDRQLLDKVNDEARLQRNIAEMLDDQRRRKMGALFNSILKKKAGDAASFRQLAEVIRTLAIEGHAVLVGRGSCLVTQALKTGLHVRLVAPRAWRVHRVADVQRLSYRDAEKVVSRSEREREKFLRSFFVQDPRVVYYHDLVIDNSRFNLVQIGEIIITALDVRFGKTLIKA